MGLACAVQLAKEPELVVAFTLIYNKLLTAHIEWPNGVFTIMEDGRPHAKDAGLGPYTAKTNAVTAKR